MRKNAAVGLAVMHAIKGSKPKSDAMNHCMCGRLRCVKLTRPRCARNFRRFFGLMDATMIRRYEMADKTKAGGKESLSAKGNEASKHLRTTKPKVGSAKGTKPTAKK